VPSYGTRLNPLAERACSSQAGGAAGVVSRTLTAPLNVLKIAMQAGQVSAGTGLAAAVAQVKMIPRRRLATPHSLHRAY
jgi:hypothetical protein